MVVLEVSMDQILRKKVGLETGLRHHTSGRQRLPEKRHFPETLPLMKGGDLHVSLLFGHENGSVLNVIDPFRRRIFLN
jgi:hypothetical protein